MTTQMLAVVTAINLGVFSFKAVPYGQSGSRPAAVPDVIRAHSLEIVDQHGRVRASLSVQPEDPKVLWKGKPYPETVLLRLISEEGRPNVKLGASKIGAALL